MFACVPVRVEIKPLRNGLLESELAARAIRIRRNNVLAEEVSARTYARARLERLLRHHVSECSKLVGPVLYGDEEVVADNYSPAVIFAVVNFPLDGGNYHSC